MSEAEIMPGCRARGGAGAVALRHSVQKTDDVVVHHFRRCHVWCSSVWLRLLCEQGRRTGPHRFIFRRAS